MERSVNRDVADLFGTLTQGVYVVGVAYAGQANAFTAAAVMQASYDPPLLALAVNVRHSSFALLRASGAFSVNVLGQGQEAFAANYARPAASDKMAFAPWSPGGMGTPLLADALAWFECRVRGELPAGDHAIVLGEAMDGRIIDPLAQPLRYSEIRALDDVAGFFPDRLGG